MAAGDNKIQWFPSGEVAAASYLVERAPAINGPWTTLATVANTQNNSWWDSVAGTFFYVDTAGNSTSWYRISTQFGDGTSSPPSTPFTASAPLPEGIPNQVRLDHDYPTPGAMRYQNASGEPIAGGVVRVFRWAEMYSGADPVGITMTDATGRWVSPIYVSAGLSYNVVFQKEQEYGPDSTTVVV